MRACADEIAGLDGQLRQLDPTAKDFGRLGQVVVQQREVKRTQLDLLQGREREAQARLAGARQAVADVEAEIRRLELAALDERADELDRQIGDRLAAYDAELRALVAELRANRVTRNRGGTNWEAGSRFVGVAPPDHPLLIRLLVERWHALGKPGTARTQEREVA